MTSLLLNEMLGLSKRSFLDVCSYFKIFHFLYFKIWQRNNEKYQNIAYRPATTIREQVRSRTNVTWIFLFLWTVTTTQLIMSDNLATKEEAYNMEQDQELGGKHYSRCSSAGSTHTPNSSAHNSGTWLFVLLSIAVWREQQQQLLSW